MEAFLSTVDREDRAFDVRTNYEFEYCGSQCWVVTHPDEEDRAYFVDMIERTCTCPDFGCTTNPMGMVCKHILAVIPDWEKLTGQTYEAPRKIVKPYDFVAVQDADANGVDPFEVL